VTEEQWIEAVRRRTHDIANRVTVNSESISIIKERLKHDHRRIEDLEELEGTVAKLEGHANVAKWIIGMLSGAIVAIAVKML